jgi:hypothetical protein
MLDAFWREVLLILLFYNLALGIESSLASGNIRRIMSSIEVGSTKGPAPAGFSGPCYLS